MSTAIHNPNPETDPITTGVKFVLGIAKGLSETQSVLFDKSLWTVEQARKWLSEHGMKAQKVDRKGKFLRFRQRPPKYKQYATVEAGHRAENPLYKGVLIRRQSERPGSRWITSLDPEVSFETLTQAKAFVDRMEGERRSNPIDFSDPVLGHHDRQHAERIAQKHAALIRETNRIAGNYALGLEYAAQRLEHATQTSGGESLDEVEKDALRQDAAYLRGLAQDYRTHDVTGVRNPENLFGFGKKLTYSAAGTSKAKDAAYRAGQRIGDTGAFDSWYSKSSFDKPGIDKKALKREFDEGVEEGEKGPAKPSGFKQGDKCPYWHWKGHEICRTEEGEYYDRKDPASRFESLRAVKKFIEDWEKGRKGNAALYTVIAQGNRKYAMARTIGQAREIARRMKAEFGSASIWNGPELVEKTNPGDPNESLQDKSLREWAENFNRVSAAPEAATTKDLRRAIGYLDHARASLIRRSQEQGRKVDANVLAGYDAEQEYYMRLIRQRDSGPLRTGNPEAAEPSLETVESEIPVFRSGPEGFSGVSYLIAYPELNQALAYAQAIKGVYPDVGVVCLEESEEKQPGGDYAVVQNANDVRVKETEQVIAESDHFDVRVTNPEPWLMTRRQYEMTGMSLAPDSPIIEQAQALNRQITAVEREIMNLPNAHKLWNDARDAMKSPKVPREMKDRYRDLLIARKRLSREADRQASHRFHVEAALAAGRAVPPEVLAEYPDLAGRSANPTRGPFHVVAVWTVRGVGQQSVTLGTFKTLKQAKSAADKYNRRGQGLGFAHVEDSEGRRQNPEQAAADMYESFHGRPADRTLEIEEPVHEHDWLAELGDLTEMEVDTLSGYHATIAFDSEQPKLASSEDGQQLYIVGGEQLLDLGKLHMSGSKWERDSMVIGEITNIVYRTEKSFDKFERLEYTHEAGEESKIRPQLVYEPKSPRLLIVGGQYRIKKPLIGTSPGIEN